MSTQRFHNFVGGKTQTNVGGGWIASTNPYNGETWAEVPQGSAKDVDEAVNHAHEAFIKGPWATINPTQRGKLLSRLADLIARDADKLAQIEVTDNGKLLAEMAGQLRYVPE